KINGVFCAHAPARKPSRSLAKDGNRACNRLSKAPIAITSMNTSTRKPRIGITLGDCAGIGPEIVDLALKSDAIAGCAEYKIIGKYPDRRAGHPTQKTARAAAAALEEAVTLARRGELDAIVTGPIHKARMYEVGFRFPGQTEFF